MRFTALSAGLLLSAAGWTSALETAAGDYVPDSLNDTIAGLGLESYVEKLPAFEKRSSGFDRCKAACKVLDLALPGDVQLAGGDSYAANKASYWALQQSSLSPSCFVAAKSPFAVAAAVTFSRVTGCPFAVRSGGHSDVPGASNVEDGITIDLRALSAVDVSCDKKTVSVGAGAKWGDVYRTLDEMGLSVTGGRAASVGVGGLTLGGGMSFFSGRKGFACDNVKNFQVLMADGRILNVNHRSYPDLYWALRGGGNNFGVVLSFDMETFPLGDMWGGLRVYLLDAKPAITKGLYTFNQHASDDPDLAMITSFMYIEGMYLSTVIADYAKPEVEPAIHADHFGDLGNPLLDTTRITNLTDLTLELGGSTPNGFRNQFTTATYKNSEELQNVMVDIFVEEVDSVLDKVSDPATLKPAIAFQPIPTTITSKFSKNGGNALGLGPEDGPLLLIQFNWSWSNIEDDEVVLQAIDKILTRSNAAAAERGLSHDYIYQNYAAPLQKPFQSYGADNVRGLRMVQGRYDPFKVFERLQPGGFKLDD